MEQIIEDLKILCAATGVSGDEFSAAQKAAELLRKYIKDAHVDSFGNVVALLPSKKEGAPTLLLDAHIDEIGMIVTAIDEKGFLKVDKCGGIDRRLLAAQVVTVHAKEKLLGVVGSKPPHLEKKEDSLKTVTFEEVYVDVGLPKEKAEELVSPGDRITMNGSFTELLNERVCSKALDDRAGVAAILECLNLLEGEELPVNLAVEFSGREETGGQGAHMAAYRLKPDISIAVDVSFAHTPDADEWKCGKLGEGTLIGFSAALDKEISDLLVSLAKEKEIAFQYEAMGGRSTGTNADDILVTRGGVRQGLLSIPLKYMHTPVEVIAVSDLKATARLMAEFIRKAGDIHVIR